MKIAHAELNRTIEIEPISPCEWVIESPKLFAKYIQELLKQSSGEEGDFIFSKDEKIIDFSKKGEIISPFSDFCGWCICVNNSTFQMYNSTPHIYNQHKLNKLLRISIQFE